MGIVSDHFERVKVSALQRESMATLARYITRKTMLAGRPYSYRNHEYQERILSDTSLEVNVQKPSQVGVSEATLRLALAMTRVIQPFTVIYTLPTAKFAGTFMNTRVAPVIRGSPDLAGILSSENDNSEVKQLGDSWIYMRGAASSNAPISIPADCLIHDERDFCDPVILTQYTSRLTHSSWKLIRNFSTPTLPDYGINKEFKSSRRFYNLCKCDKCGHSFSPDYYRDVKIPGFDGDLTEVTKRSLAILRWQEAVLLCPRCGRAPSLQIEHREWVCENPEEKLVAAGYQITPFDAPNIVTPSDLIKSSTSYEHAKDFVNFGLGLPVADKESAIYRDDITRIMLPGEASGNIYVMGVDVGNTYHFKIGAVTPDGGVRLVHVEKVRMGALKDRYFALKRRFRPACSIMDSAPHAETVLSLQALDPTLYAAVYMRSKSMSAFRLLDEDEDSESAKEFLRQINVNRNRAFDSYMGTVRDGGFTVDPRAFGGDDELKEEYISHHLSMKRARIYDSDSGELTYNWTKTDGKDHFHHAGVYLHLASRILGAVHTERPFNPFEAMKLRRKN